MNSGQCAVCSIQCAMFHVQFSVSSVQCPLLLQSVVDSNTEIIVVKCAVCRVQCAVLCSVQCAVCSVV